MPPGEHRRINGWTWPWHPYQIISWIFVIVLVTLSFLSSLPLPHFPLYPASILICYLWLLLCMLIMTSVDPGYGGAQISPQRFDSTVFQHVIENNYCHICQIEVPIKAKHCKYCNKCIAGFDHHCKWLNNCVGNKNYKMFFILVSSITLISASILIINSLFIYFLIAGTFSKDSNTEAKFLSMFNWKYITMWPWMIITIFCATFHLILFAVTAHLYRFHIMLWKKGMTTYSYIVNIRKPPHPNSRDTLTGGNDGVNSRLPHGRAVYDSSTVNHAVSAPFNNVSSRPLTPPRRLPDLKDLQRPLTADNRPRKIHALPFGHIPRTLTMPQRPKSSNIERTANPV